MQVAEHKVDVLVISKLLQGLFAGMAGYAVVTVTLQKRAQLFDDNGLVINNQQL
ncbi:hypothetical protein D3C81_1975830 [compost metagenome]